MAPGTPTPDHEPTVVTVNLGLKWRHLIAGFLAVSGAIGSAATAGWLVLPAKQSDLTRVEQSLDVVRSDMKTQQEITLKLIQAVERLDNTVKTIRVVAPKRKTK